MPWDGAHGDLTRSCTERGPCQLSQTTDGRKGFARAVCTLLVVEGTQTLSAVPVRSHEGMCESKRTGKVATRSRTHIAHSSTRPATSSTSPSWWESRSSCKFTERPASSPRAPTGVCHPRRQAGSPISGRRPMLRGLPRGAVTQTKSVVRVVTPSTCTLHQPEQRTYLDRRSVYSHLQPFKRGEGMRHNRTLRRVIQLRLQQCQECCQNGIVMKKMTAGCRREPIETEGGGNNKWNGMRRED